MNAWIETDIDDPAFAGAQSRQKRVRHIESRQDILPVAITAPPWAVNAFRRLIPALLTRVEPRPILFSISSATCRQRSRSRTSSVRLWPLPPARLIVWAVSAAELPSMSRATILRAFSCIAQGNGVTDTRPTAGYHCQVSFEQACHGSSSHQSAH